MAMIVAMKQALVSWNEWVIFGLAGIGVVLGMVANLRVSNLKDKLRRGRY